MYALYVCLVCMSYMRKPQVALGTNPIFNPNPYTRFCQAKARGAYDDVTYAYDDVTYTGFARPKARRVSRISPTMTLQVLICAAYAYDDVTHTGSICV